MGKIKWDALDLLFKCFKDLKAANFYVKAGHLISLNFDDTYLYTNSINLFFPVNMACSNFIIR